MSTNRPDERMIAGFDMNQGKRANFGGTGHMIGIEAWDSNMLVTDSILDGVPIAGRGGIEDVYSLNIRLSYCKSQRRIGKRVSINGFLTCVSHESIPMVWDLRGILGEGACNE